MELDPEIAAVLAELNKRSTVFSQDANTFSLSTPENVAATRARIERGTEIWNATLDRANVHTELRTIPATSVTPPLGLRIHKPATSKGPLPCLYHIHGGGMVSGSTLRDDGILIPLVRNLHCIATSIEYRLAPEFTGPAAAVDCYTGLQWVFKHAAELGIDAERIALGGVSGGGGIAARTALMARDKGGPQPCFQQLICPQLDDRHITESSRGDWTGWTRNMNLDAWKAVLGNRVGTPDVSAYESAPRASTLAGLPPTFIEVGSMEIFRDECIDYAARLLRDGVPTELHVYPGCFHGFHLFAPHARITKLAFSAQYDALKRAWWPIPPD